MVALDVSRSMLAQDMKPTRLGRAKLEISDMISQLDGDEVGIVLFSGASFIQFPLTSDYPTARTYLNHASPDAISRQGHRDRRGYRDGDDRIQQPAGGSENHRHYDGR